MGKNTRLVNGLINKRNLILRIKKKKIMRVNKEASLFIEESLTKNLDILLDLAKEEMTINGRKTLKKDDIVEALNKLKKENQAWEI